MELSENDIVRFWSKVDIKGHDECWNWKTGCFDEGYGAFHLNRKSVKANRISLILSCCPQPENKLFSLHTCKQNRKCCNPSHLYWGDKQDNSNDMKLDETMIHYTGEENGSAKLTEIQVLEIREKYIPKHYTLKNLADEYGVTTTNISDIINRKIWKHL